MTGPLLALAELSAACRLLACCNIMSYPIVGLCPVSGQFYRLEQLGTVRDR